MCQSLREQVRNARTRNGVCAPLCAPPPDIVTCTCFVPVSAGRDRVTKPRGIDTWNRGPGTAPCRQSLPPAGSAEAERALSHDRRPCRRHASCGVGSSPADRPHRSRPTHDAPGPRGSPTARALAATRRPRPGPAPPGGRDAERRATRRAPVSAPCVGVRPRPGLRRDPGTAPRRVAALRVGGSVLLA